MTQLVILIRVRQWREILNGHSITRALFIIFHLREIGTYLKAIQKNMSLNMEGGVPMPWVTLVKKWKLTLKLLK